MKSVKYALIAIVALFIFAGCKVNKPKEVLTETQLEALLYDYHIARSMGDNLPYNENYKRRLYMDYVFEKHHTSEAVFDSSLVWYTRHADLLSKIYERVNERFKIEQNDLDSIIAIRERKPKTSAPGDSVELWFLKKIYRLDAYPYSNKIIFTIPSDSNFMSRDTLQWSVYYRFLGHQPDSVEMAVMSMAVQYKNDSIISETKKIFGPGMQRIRLQADSINDIREVRGYIYYTNLKDSLRRHLFADSISLMRFHTNDSIYALLHDTIPAVEELKEDTINIEKAEEKPEEVQPQEKRLTPEEMRDRRNRLKSSPVQRTPLPPDATTMPKQKVEPIRPSK